VKTFSVKALISLTRVPEKRPNPRSRVRPGSALGLIEAVWVEVKAAILALVILPI